MISGNNQSGLLSLAKDLSVKDWGKTLVVAPHPDDESLGCGGTIALLREAGTDVAVVFTSDGSMSHPNSRQYPSAQLTALRETEALAALQVLGVSKSGVHFMRLKDSLVPGNGTTGFDKAVIDFGKILREVQPEMLLLPWRRDPHKDHRATWQIVNAAVQQFNKPARQLEYLIWLWERGETNEFPTTEEATIWRVDIEKSKQLKKQAIAQHLSQTTRLIDDDPHGFILSPEVISHFEGGYEVFIEITGH